MARMAETRPILGGRRWVKRNVATATRLTATHRNPCSGMLEQDPGAMSLHVALAEVQHGMRR